MIAHTPIASAELAIQLLDEASVFLDNFCENNSIPLEVAIGITMTAADAKGGFGVAREMQSASSIIMSNYGSPLGANRHERRKKSKEASRRR